MQELFFGLSASEWLAVSLALAVVAIGVFKLGTPTNLAAKFGFAAMVGLVGLYSVFYYTIDALTGRGFDESVLYHYERGLAGAGFADFWQLAVLTTLLVLASVAIAYWVFNARTGSPSAVRVMSSFGLIFVSVAVHPLTYDLYKLDLIPRTSISTEQVTLAFNEAYVDPAELGELSFDKNVVFVYAESLERTYFNNGLFPDVVQHLKELEQQAVAFTNIRHARGTGWTHGRHCFNPVWHSVGNHGVKARCCLGCIQ